MNDRAADERIAELEAELEANRNVAEGLTTRLRYAQRRSRDRLDTIDRYREALERIADGLPRDVAIAAACQALNPEQDDE